jgi:hypothetical protein
MKGTWRRWLWKFAASVGRRNRSVPRRARPTIEPLEDRLVPSGVPPFVESINRPVNAPYITTAPSVSFTVVFNENVTGVAANDFALALTGTVAVTQPLQVTVVSASVYSVAVSGISGLGTLGLNLLNNDSIQDLAGDPLVGNFTGQIYQFADIVDPYVVSIDRSSPPYEDTSLKTVVFTVTFSEAVTGVDASAFQLAITGTAAAASMQVMPVSGSIYTVTLSGITGKGQMGLNLVDNDTIHDLVGHPLVSGGAATSFLAPNTYAAGNTAAAVAIADVNGDGIPDVITASSANNNVSVLLGNGNGTFQAGHTFATGKGPDALVVADVTSDGTPDIVTANYTGNTVSVLLGNGNGTFQAAESFATGTDPKSLAEADVNGDGIIDLVVANRGDNDVGVLLGNGNGTFQAQQTFATSVAPDSVACTDINGDGIPDIAVANYGVYKFLTVDYATNNVGVLLGNGNGTFQQQATFIAGIHPRSLAVADFNNDGKPDLVVLNAGFPFGLYGPSSGSISLLLGNGDGTFQARSNNSDLGNAELLSKLAVADVNGDGRPDLVVTNGETGQVDVMSYSAGQFQVYPLYHAAAAVAVADLNGDGRPDIVAVGGSPVQVILNSGNGDFTGQVFNFGDPGPPTHFVVAAGPSTVTAGGNVVFTVTAEDSVNETCYNYVGSVVFSSSDSAAGFIKPGATLTSGIGKFSVTLKTVGSQNLTATDNNTTGLTGTVTGASGTITVVPAMATRLTVNAPSTAVAGNVFFFTVSAFDPFGNLATTYADSVQISTNDALIVSGNSPLNNGVGNFFVVWDKTGPATLTATDTITSSITGSSGAITVEPGAPSKLILNAPSNIPAGGTYTFTVTAQDAFQNTVTDYAGPLNFTTTDSNATLPSQGTLTSGVGVFSAVYRTAGSQTLTIADNNNNSLSASASVTVLPGTASHFVVSSSSNSISAGGAVLLVITAEDQFNNSAPGYNGTVHLTSTDSQASLADDSMLDSGVGTFFAILRSSGSQTITAKDTSIASLSGSTGNIVVSPDAPSRFEVYPGLTTYPGINTGPGSFAATGLPLPYTVVAVDQFNNLATTYSGTVQFTTSDRGTGVVLPGSSTMASGSGIFSATLVTAGTQTLTANDPVNGIAGVSSPFVTRGLVATSFRLNPSGFVITFDKPFNPGNVILYTTGAVPDDVLLTTSGTQVSVRGSLLIDPNDTSITFVKTDSISAAGTFNPANGLLAAGSYTLTLRSFNSLTGFADNLGTPLDGSNTGGNSNYQIAFSVNAPPVAVGIPDFARGPSNTDAVFFSTTLTNGSTFALSYTNPAANPSTGTATITFSSSAATLASNLQTALSSGGLSTQVGINTGADNTPNSVVIVTNDTSTGANVLISFQSALAQATDELLFSSTAGVSISAATINVANNIPGDGIPIALSSGLNVTSGNFTLQYNPSLLTISGVVSKIAGASFTLVSNDTVAGTAVLSFSSPTRISSTAAPITLGSLLAGIPFSATASYGTAQLLHFSSEQLGGTAGPVAVTNADGVDLAAYFGDTTDVGAPLNLPDVAAVAAVASAIPNVSTHTIPGFGAFPTLDPALIGDVSLQGSVTSTDAGAMTQEIAGIAKVTIPYAPIGPPAPPPRGNEEQTAMDAIAPSNRAPPPVAAIGLAIFVSAPTAASIRDLAVANSSAVEAQHPMPDKEWASLAMPIGGGLVGWATDLQSVNSQEQDDADRVVAFFARERVI